jgi:hypothetical protein
MALLSLIASTALTAPLSPFSYIILSLTNYITPAIAALIGALNAIAANITGPTSN